MEEDRHAIIDVAGGRGWVLGYSSGAVLALHAAAEGRPIERLFLYEPPFRFDREEPAWPADLAQRLQQMLDEGHTADVGRMSLCRRRASPPGSPNSATCCNRWAGSSNCGSVAQPPLVIIVAPSAISTWWPSPTGRFDEQRQATVTTLHQELDAGVALGLDLGCAYVDAARAADGQALHPTWTHGKLVRRAVSGISRAELVRYGWAVFGPSPTAVLPPMSDDDVRRAAHAELSEYWTHAARRPWWWLDPVIAELAPSAMARGRPRSAYRAVADQDRCH